VEPGPAAVAAVDLAEEPRGMPIEVLPHTYHRSVVDMNPINHR
jgi:hypothetical protein